MSEGNSTTPVGQVKRCSKCKEIKPIECFSRSSSSKDGLRYSCKECRRRWYLKNQKREVERGCRWIKENSEHRKKYMAEYNAKHGVRIKMQRKNFRNENREAIAQAETIYYEKKKWKVLAYRKAWYQANRVRLAADRRLASASRRGRIKELPNDFTASDVRMAADFWNGYCAVCEVDVRLFGNAHWDHWIPISSRECPGTIPQNMVLLCSLCNFSKRDKDPEIWLVKSIGKRKARQVIERIVEYQRAARRVELQL